MTIDYLYIYFSLSRYVSISCHHFLSALSVTTSCKHFLSALSVITSCHHFLSALSVCTSCQHFLSELSVCNESGFAWQILVDSSIQIFFLTIIPLYWIPTLNTFICQFSRFCCAVIYFFRCRQYVSMALRIHLCSKKSFHCISYIYNTIMSLCAGSEV